MNQATDVMVSNPIPPQQKDQPQSCTSCHLLGGTIMSGFGIRNLYYAKNQANHKTWLAVTGGLALAFGLNYGLYPFVHQYLYVSSPYANPCNLLN